MKKLIIALILICGLLYATNPDKRDFDEWVKGKLADRVEESSNDTDVDAFFGSIFSNVGSWVSSKMTTEKNYYLVSIYTADLGEEQYNYLGIFKTFVPLQAENPLERKEE
jgi:hypothetical protein